ncbi:hypothetical protein Tco_1378986 [Tanacetum coccineum]
MASDGNDQDSEYALSKLLQMGTVEDYQRESKLATLGEALSLARIAEARFEDERSTIVIAKTNELTANVHVQDLEQTTRGSVGYDSSHDIPYYCGSFKSNLLSSWCSNLEELQENQEEHICYYYWENYFSILNTEAGNTKSPFSADTFGNSGVDESETLGPETLVKEVVDNGNGFALIFLVGYGTGSEVVIGLPKEFQEGDMVDALSRVLEQKSSKKGVDNGSERRDYALFGASLFAFLNPGPCSFAHRRIWDPEIKRVFLDNTLRTR